MTDETHRADAVLVGAADAVGVVVGVVDADLEEQRDDEREQRIAGVRLLHRVGRARSDEDGGDGGGQRAGARALDPLVQGGHVRDVLQVVWAGAPAI